YLLIDQNSTLMKRNMASLLDALAIVRSPDKTPAAPFAGMNIILFGDLFDFPPLAGSPNVLYRSINVNKHSATRCVLFDRFRTVVTLCEQHRTQDTDWAALLENIRMDCCTVNDVSVLRSLILGGPNTPDFSTPAWFDVTLTSPCISVVAAWNQMAI
ncbi:hypothetical protein DFH07DRAFT_691644, partial [Mycena maculata]